MKNFGTNLPQLDLTWANLFGPSCEYINLWQQQQWERRASFPTLKSVQVVCHNLIQFGADNMQHASNNSSNKKVTEHITCLWLISHVPCTDLLAPSLPPCLPLSLLSPPSLKCCQTASETLDEHLPHTWLTCQAAHSMCVYMCVCECDCDCELAYTPLHTWVGTVAEKS